MQRSRRSAKRGLLRGFRSLLFEQLETRRVFAAVPAFSSLPGSPHTIYLDFDGQTVQNTGWNSYYNQATLVAQPYDIDGDSSTFNATELARIEEAWKRVAEDFSPFNINVTTVDPGLEALRRSGSTDGAWGVRAIITKESTMLADPNEACGCGGIAYIDSFTSSADLPVWVYTSGGKSVAEAASHEVGHSLGLSHDGLIGGASYYSGHGSGETGWASIMGVGYYENVTQWDRGEYYNSNNGDSGANYGDGPDDLAIIVGNNGFTYRNDDHGNSFSLATPLMTSGNQVSGQGVIERTNDVDVFAFSTAAGPVDINILPFTPGPNLDVRAELYDSSGALVAVSDSATTLAASFSMSLAAGTYYLKVDGTGWGDPGSSTPSGYSEYASLGQYTIAGSIVQSTLPTVSISDSSANEGNGQLSLSLTLSSAATQTTSVQWTAVDETATAGLDYIATSGTVTFQAGQTTATLMIQLVDDSVYESNETFRVTLSNPVGLSLGDGQAVATIIDNDSAPAASLAVSDASVLEGKLNTKGKNAGTPQLTNMNFVVSLSAASATTVSVQYASADGTGSNAATAGDDYLPVQGVLTFAPGETSKSIAVTVIGDNNVEPDELFSVVLSGAAGASIGDAVAVGTIVNDDSSGGKGGGKGGGGKPNKIAGAEYEMIVDPIWFFEAPGDVGHSHSHDGFALSDSHDDHDVLSSSPVTLGSALLTPGTSGLGRGADSVLASRVELEERLRGLSTDRGDRSSLVGSALAKSVSNDASRTNDMALMSVLTEGNRPSAKGVLRALASEQVELEANQLETLVVYV